MILDEQTLLSMPDEEYMNAEQLGFFRRRLEALRDDLLHNLASTSERLRESEDKADPADRATQEEEHVLELRTRDRERKLLRKIETGLQRIQQGTYGYCTDTSESIGLKRLLARPTTTLTIEAQERHERRERQFGS